MRLGVHVPIAGGLLEAVARAERLGCTTMQIFSRSPRGGPALRLSQEAAGRFDRARRSTGIEPLAIHAPYILNLASPEPAVWQRSVALYREEYARAAALQAQYLVTHVGSHRGEGEAAGMERVSEAITRTLEGGSAPVMILLENTAGSGQGLGYDFDQLAFMRNRVKAKDRVGICLDTAHLFAAGYPIHTEEGLEEVVAAFDRIIGLDRLKVIHLNDSKAPFQSRVDRHWHIGEGHIGPLAFRRLVTHPRLRDIPLILETPKQAARPPGPPMPIAGAGGHRGGRARSFRMGRAEDAEDRRNLATVRRLAGAGQPSRRPRVTVG
jgi:deoxyribonuclease-4